jgi:superoxide dismutase, Cu-Zn family
MKGHSMRAISLASISMLLLTAILAIGQSKAKPAQADIINAKGEKIGTAKFEMSDFAAVVKVSIKVDHLTPGQHGVHIHNVGKCEGPAFTTAGPHFNPTSAHHGVNNPQDPKPHAGDMANLNANFIGHAEANFELPSATLGSGPNSLFHDGGTSIVVHAQPDDLKSDPSGNSGDRVACGVIEK